MNACQVAGPEQRFGMQEKSTPPLFRKFGNSSRVILRKTSRLLVDVGWELKPNVSLGLQLVHSKLYEQTIQ